MNKRYQVYVSCRIPWTDEQRRGVVRAIVGTGCIPVGMDLGAAGDEEEREIAERVVHDCDYYLLIEGRGAEPRVDNETEYATSRGVAVIALMQEARPQSPREGPSIAPATASVTLRNGITSGRIVRTWGHSAELPGAVALGLSLAIRTRPAIGWVRGDVAATADLLAEADVLRRERDALRAKLAALQATIILSAEGIAGLDDEVVVRLRSKMRSHPQWQASSVRMKWRDVFGRIGAHLLSRPSDRTVRSMAAGALMRADSAKLRRHEIDDEDFQTIRLTLKALGLVDLDDTQTRTGGTLRWGLTPRGEHLLLQCRAVTPSADRPPRAPDAHAEMP